MDSHYSSEAAGVLLHEVEVEVGRGILEDRGICQEAVRNATEEVELPSAANGESRWAVEAGRRTAVLTEPDKGGKVPDSVQEALGEAMPDVAEGMECLAHRSPALLPGPRPAGAMVLVLEEALCSIVSSDGICGSENL